MHLMKKTNIQTILNKEIVLYLFNSIFNVIKLMNSILHLNFMVVTLKNQEYSDFFLS